MNTNEYGQVTFEVDEVLSMLYTGQSIADCVLSDAQELSLHQKDAKKFEIDPLPASVKPQQPALDYHAVKSSAWQMPEQYKTLDIEQLLSQKMADKGLLDAVYVERISSEMHEYRSRNMIDTLRFLHYLMDTCKQHAIVTGIGRGSSVSSLVLHLLDVHHIDPVKYDLHYNEFLR